MPITLIENFRAVFYTPFYAAFALQAYEAEGLEVRRVTSSDPAQTMQALLSGQGDVAWGGPIRLLLDNNQRPSTPRQKSVSGLDAASPITAAESGDAPFAVRSTSNLVIFCEVIRRDPFFLVGRVPNPSFQLTDLLNIRLATVSEVPTPWLCLQHDLRLAGLDPAHVSRTADQTMPQNLAALRAGEIDVMQAFQPFVEQAVEAGVGHIWYAAAARGLAAYTSLYTTREFLARQPESLLRMTRAMYRTQQWIATHTAAELAACVASYFPDLALPTLTQALQRYTMLHLWNRTPMLRPEGLAWLQAACLSGGYIQHGVPYEQCVDMQFASRVMQETPATVDEDSGT